MGIEGIDIRRQNESILEANLSKNRSSLLSTIKKIDETARDYSKATVGLVKRNHDLVLNSTKNRRESQERYDSLPRLKESLF